MGCCCLKTSKDSEKEGLKTVRTSPPWRGEASGNVIGKSSGALGSSCSKEVLRKKVDQASKTRVLALRECGLKYLPEDATKEGILADLRTADLAINRITALPPTIQTWAQLQSLNASDNLLEQLPVAILTLVQLKKLILSRNRLVALPERLGELSLTELKCDGNKLLGLPDCFGGNIAATLEELDVSNNRLQLLPKSICDLRMIMRLVLQNNQLPALPLHARSNECMSRLQYVNAAENNISSIAPETLQLPVLSELWLKGNPMDRLALQQMPGFEEFAARRKQRLDQKIDSHVVGGVELAMCGL